MYDMVVIVCQYTQIDRQTGDNSELLNYFQRTCDPGSDWASVAGSAMSPSGSVAGV